MVKTIARWRLAAEGAFLRTVSGSKLELAGLGSIAVSINPFLTLARVCGPSASKTSSLAVIGARGRSVGNLHRHLGFDGRPESGELEIDQQKRLFLPLKVLPITGAMQSQQKAEDWATEIASGELEVQEGGLQRSDENAAGWASSSGMRCASSSIMRSSPAPPWTAPASSTLLGARDNNFRELARPELSPHA